MTTPQLPVDCWHRIAIYAEFSVLVSLHSCSKYLRDVMSSFFDSRYNRFLSKMDLNPKRFREILVLAEAIIGGGAVRMLLEGKQEMDGIPLHIFCKAGQGILFHDVLLNGNYDFDGEDEITHGVAPHTFMITVHRFSNQHRLIDIIESPWSTFLLPRSRFRHSSQFGIASASTICHAYPNTIGKPQLSIATDSDYSRLPGSVRRSFGDSASLHVAFGHVSLGDIEQFPRFRLPVWSDTEGTPLMGFEPTTRQDGEQGDEREFVRMLWASLFSPA
ncbi:hypothetical protein NLI96_g3682 [Meripilus lineatus]|uniref:F-box domain-containing protein n=1 Tax=Meripilus lineatus TaxID=2056292 RepID=A0AAD5V6B3_9APHY|nr:hypothetical protein NLI96_g3682 [Physisporinus lineatus]